jgi:hypothetical protein
MFAHVVHDEIYACPTVGTLVSILYCPFRVDVFPAQSLAHKYKIWSPADGVIVLPFTKVVPFQQSLLSHLYFAVVKFVSPTLKVTVGATFTQLLELLLALTLGDMVS